MIPEPQIQERFNPVAQPRMAGVKYPTESENAIQERPNALAWLAFHAVAIYSSVSFWFRSKRICTCQKPDDLKD
jgi:hypothetical protein